LGSPPEVIINDSKLRNFPGHQLVFGVGPGYALCGFRILCETLPIIGYPTNVQFVVEYTVAALLIAIDRRSVPLASPRTRDTFTVEPRGNSPRRQGTCVG
jgi:hypothetical protein